MSKSHRLSELFIFLLKAATNLQSGNKIFGKVSSNKKSDLDGLNGYYDTEKLQME